MYYRYYHVVAGCRHIDIVLAKSADEAIAIVESRFGSSCSYSTEPYQAGLA